ncbi:GATA transcription factor 29-like [Raphanus sativus]|uniref:GATA transcription factor 29-like n=1 Tax=Raphanus sativus TaxID=3726 RepID=A0A9W3BZP0_RAPSA|nr:GATA transcription factor 29-like [Raphanus sativus]
MENELDLTLRLGLSSPTVETHLSLSTLAIDQGNNVDGNRRDNNNDSEIFWKNNESTNDHEGVRKNVDVNIQYYNLVFNHFAGIGETLNFAPFPTQPSPAPATETPMGSEHVLIDVPAKRAQRNSLAFKDAVDANATLVRRWGCSGACLAGRINEMRKCTNKNCNAINTPMWRKGPLGPKSLCNACGIKFRKEKERRGNGTE